MRNGAACFGVQSLFASWKFRWNFHELKHFVGVRSFWRENELFAKATESYEVAWDERMLGGRLSI